MRPRPISASPRGGHGPAAAKLLLCVLISLALHAPRSAVGTPKAGEPVERKASLPQQNPKQNPKQKPPPKRTVRPQARATATVVRARQKRTGKVTTRQGTAATPRGGSGIAAQILLAERRCGGLRIERVRLSGCLGTRCQDERERKRFIHLTDLLPTVILQTGMLARARTRLEETRFFRVVHLRCQRVGNAARLSVGVVGNSVIRRVRFRGNQVLFTAELRNKVQLQPGDVLNPGSAETKRVLEQQRRAILGAYGREGFDAVQVKLTVTTVGVGQVELLVSIDEGDRKRVNSRTLSVVDQHRPTPQERAAGLICRAVSERALLRGSGLNDVDVFTRRAGVRGRSRIRALLRQLGYANPRVSVTHVEAQQTVRVRVQLGRCNVVRIFERETDRRQNTAGNWRLSDEPDYSAALPFAQSGVFDMDEAERGRRALSALLENRGYFFSDVRLEVREVPRAWQSRVRRAITFRITTGYRAQVRGLRFPGAKHFTRAELLEAMVTRAYDFFDDGGYLQTAQLLGDLNRLRQQYRNAGFFEFHFNMVATAASARIGLRHRRKAAGGMSVVDILGHDRGFRVRRPANEHFIYIDVPVTEGRRTRLGRLTIAGINRKGQRRNTELFGLKRGQVLSFSRMVVGLKAVESWYQDHGFFQAKVAVLCRVRGAATESLTAAISTPVDPCLRAIPPASAQCPPRDPTALRCSEDKINKTTKTKAIKTRRCRPDDWCRCTQERILGESVDLRLQIHEGPRVRIGEVFISGNFVTSGALLTRYMPKFNSLYSGPVLFDALRKIRNLGLFRSVSIQQIGADECPPRKHVALVVRVVENDRTTIDLDAGFQTANVNRGAANNNGIGKPPPFLVDVLEHFVASGARLNMGSGERVGAELPKLVLTLSADVRNRNFRGEGEELRGVFRMGVSSDINDLARQPFSLGLLAASWTIPRLPYDVSLKVIPFASRDFVTTIVDVDKVGLATELTKRFFRTLSVSLGAEGGAVSYRPKPTDLNMTPFSLQMKIIPRATWDRLNSPINPTHGFYGSTSLAYINAVIEDGDQQTANQGNFLKFEAQLKWFGTLRDTFTLGILLRGGAAVRLGQAGTAADAGLPSNETFRLGGQLGLRGITDNGVLQYGNNGAPLPLVDKDGTVICVGQDDKPPCTATGIKPRADGAMLLAGTVEGRFPLVRRAGLWGAVFWDWGVVANDVAGLSYSKAFRHGVGIGLRFLISGQIPLRIDYGIALDRRCTQPFAAMGQRSCQASEEFGQLQAGLLYAF